MDEVTLVDLDMGTCQPSPGSPTDDARLLPWSDRLQAALQVLTTLHNTANLTLQAAASKLAPHLAACTTVCQAVVMYNKASTGLCYHNGSDFEGHAKPAQ